MNASASFADPLHTEVVVHTVQPENIAMDTAVTSASGVVPHLPVVDAHTVLPECTRNKNYPTSKKVWGGQALGEAFAVTDKEFTGRPRESPITLTLFQESWFQLDVF